MNTLVHGYIANGGPRIVAKLKGWKELKAGDGISFSFKRKHFFDKETTNAIRGGK
jgi:multiple sugar transport system ATP-binding protein